MPSYRKSRCQLSQSRTALFANALEGELVASHGEIYLELANVDLVDPDAIAQFASKYSVLGGDEMYRRLRDAGRFRNPYRRGRNTFPRDQRLEIELAEREVWARDDLSLYKAEVETLYAFRFAAIVFRGMVLDWREITTRTAPTPPAERPCVVAGGLYYTPSLADLPELLRSYTPTLTVSRLHDRDAVRAWRPPEIIAEAPPVSAPLFEVCAFELYNHITESATYHRCANETCGRLFVHQHGRAVHRQNRSRGVKYCSHLCAQAQNQRTYRRRRQARLDQRSVP
jgi:hypothetical protein